MNDLLNSVQEITIKKTGLEEDISNLIHEFQQKTGLKVSDFVEVTQMYAHGAGASRLSVPRIKVNVEL